MELHVGGEQTQAGELGMWEGVRSCPLQSESCVIGIIPIQTCPALEELLGGYKRSMSLCTSVLRGLTAAG